GAVRVLHEGRAQMLARAVPGDDEIGDDRVALRLAHRANRVEPYRVARHHERLARRERLLGVHGARLTRRHGQRDENDPDMHDVAAVPAAAAAQEVRECGDPALAMKSAARSHPARELLDYRG